VNSTRRRLPVNIAGSGAAADIEMPVGVAVPGAHALASAETVADPDLVRLTIPLPQCRTRPARDARREPRHRQGELL